MVVGKTHLSISKNEILERFSEQEIFLAIFPNLSLPCLINSPFRKDVHPSLSIFEENGRIFYKDHADINEKGSLITFLCRYWKCSFTQCLDNIWDIMTKGMDITAKPKKIRMFSKKGKDDEAYKIQVAVRPWKDYDYAYWESYGVTRKWLHYAKIFPISHKIVTKKVKTGEGTIETKTYTIPADKHAYVFVESKEGRTTLKIYQPYNKNGHKWCSKMDDSVIGLWTKIPETGDRVVICSSLKDALCVSCQLHIPALCLQGEGYGMSQTAINELKRRYDKVFISFDTDERGIEYGRKLSEVTGFKHIVPDLGKEKDFSDYYKSLENKKQFQQLETLFH